jgi:formamidopyrimidine-DNA glycosylase
LGSERRAKNIQIHLSSGKTILIHLKMTGHLLYGNYFFDSKKNTFYPEGGFVSREELLKDKGGEKKSQIHKNPLKDPFNKFIHFAIIFSDEKVLVLSDMRKFASVFYKKTDEVEGYFANIGPEPFDINPSEFCKIAKKKKGKIKSILMDPEFVAGIGNIYSDEIL